MAFRGCEFVFNGKSCREYGMILYGFDTYKQDESFSFTSVGSMVEDRLENKTTPLAYGKNKNKAMEYRLVFGPKDDDGLPNYLDRWDVEAISSWLTDPKGYSWLEIHQEDMQDFRYRCYISGLELVSHNSEPLVFSCNVTCDGPYAYTYPETYTIDLNGEEFTAILHNKSTGDEFYYPEIDIRTEGHPVFQIINHSVDDEKFSLTELPESVKHIHVDGDRQIITSDLDILNPYDHFNFTYLRLCKGDNILSFKGEGQIKVTCVFPRNIGG